jgi:hypothetical protein
MIFWRGRLPTDYLWKVANLSYTPKIHSILVHELDEMKQLQGIGDMLEDDVEHIHQMAARIETQTSRSFQKRKYGSSCRA